MKKIIYTRADGRLSVVHPCEGNRHAFAIKALDGTDIQRDKVARPVDTFLRGWPVEGVTAEWAETEDEFLARVQAKSVPATAMNVQIVDASAIPSDRTFRNSWRGNGATVYCDMAETKELGRNMLRRERAERFKVLDGQWMRATARGDTLAAIAAEDKRETMRNWPQDPRIPNCVTPEELKALLATMKAEV